MGFWDELGRCIAAYERANPDVVRRREARREARRAPPPPPQPGEWLAKLIAWALMIGFAVYMIHGMLFSAVFRTS